MRTHAEFNGILEMQHEAIVLLREDLQGRKSTRIVQIAQDDDHRPALQRRRNLACPMAE